MGDTARKDKQIGEASETPSGTDALSLIAAERARQIEAEGWDVAHDDEHEDDELACAAACYALPASERVRMPNGITVKDALWPWAHDETWWKPTPEDRVRELVKAGALIVAEIDRLQRAEASRV